MTSTSPDAEKTVAAERACTFPGSTLLSPLTLAKLRLHQEGFAQALAARLSLLFRLDFSTKLNQIQTISYQQWMRTWNKPASLTLFKLDPLRGVSVVQMPPRLGSAMVDRLMGGPGQALEGIREFSEIERALLEQAVQILLNEWCRQWAAIKELKPVLLGYETDGDFVQIAPQTNMLVLSLEAGLGACSELIQIGFPYAGVESLVQQLSRDAEMPVELKAAPNPPSVLQWKSCFDDIPVSVKAEWHVMELAVRDVANLKVGDILQIDAPSASHQVSVRLGDQIKFKAQVGTVNNRWAIELTEIILP